MENDHKNNYSAHDIERYHKGLMSKEEMHAMEKAALDDPFLADAMQGYAIAHLDLASDISILKNQLHEKINREKQTIFYRNNQFWKLAAMFIIIVGVSIFIYQYTFRNNEKDFARIENNQPTFKSNDLTNQEKISDTLIESGEIIKDDQAGNKQEITEGKKANKLRTLVTKPTAKNDSVEQDANLSVRSSDVSVTPIQQEKRAPLKEISNDIKSAEASDVPLTRKQEILKKESENNRMIAQPQMNNINLKTNIFKGQILDSNNNPLPFANITNTKDNVGTYSDAKGYFTFTSTDSILDVEVKSIGFINNYTLLRNDVKVNRVVLGQDRNTLNEVVLSNKKANTNRNRESRMIFEESEPFEGWINYDTYIANNIKIPDELRTKATIRGEVELSFDVNRSGEPVNIKVEKSLCNECDQEAIRLVKKGPKWKKKKGRGRVVVPF